MMRAITLEPSLQVVMRGPALEEGALPALFYFALTGEEALNLAPINQPAEELASYPLRFFSVTLPFHQIGEPFQLPLEKWLSMLQRGENFLIPFVEKIVLLIEKLIMHSVLLPHHIAVGGLSRGGWIAAQLAARHPAITSLLLFSPLTDFTYSNTFKSLTAPWVNALALHAIIPSLLHCAVSCYIGNADEMVNTTACCSFICNLATAAVAAKMRSPEIHLKLFPSIGRKGHGTPPAIFAEGAHWVAQRLINKTH